MSQGDDPLKQEGPRQGPLPLASDGMAGAETAAFGQEQATVAARPPAEGRVGRFRLRAQLGEGGFGKVYLAHDPQLDRLVALKVSKRAFEGPQDAQRFLGEALAAARLRHPNIVAVFDSGQDGDTCFIASEYVDGVSLDKWLKARRAPLRPAVGWVRDLALALDYAHGQGIVHRDVKPANIMIGPDGRPQLTDFGLARRAEDPRRTEEGVVQGTPAYMAPEQARGETRNVGPKSDQYSLGVVLYELLTGRLPFQGPGQAILSWVAHEEAPPPRSIDPHIPPDLEAICLRAMARDPARRYPSAKEFALDLGRFLAGEPTRARPPGRWERAARWVRRHRTLAGMVAAAAAAMIATLAVVLSIYRGAPIAESEPQEPPGAVAPPGAEPPSTDEEDRLLPSRLTRSSNNLKQIGLAAQHYQDVYRRFPAAAIFGRDGKPLLSWRVALLPYLDEKVLFQRFRLDEPWDSPHNKTLLPLMPRVYAAPGTEYDSPTTTFYQACVGPEAPFSLEPSHQLTLRDLSNHDGTSHTIMVLEAAAAVPWTKPEDVAWDGRTAPRLGGIFPGFHACMFDASVVYYRPSIYEDGKALTSLLGWRDGQVADWRRHEGYPEMKRFPGVPVPGLAAAPDWARKAQIRAASLNQLRQIAMAMLAHHSASRCLPPHAIYSRDGKPLLSWRVALLPYLNERTLHRQFKLDEPWDSPQNRPLADRIPRAYAVPASVGLPTENGLTFCQVVVGPGTPFPPSSQARVLLAEIAGADGAGQTILVAEAATPVIWTRPDDILLDAPDAVPKFGGLLSEGFQAAMADGSALQFKKEIYADADALRALVGCRDGQLIDFNRYEGELIDSTGTDMPPAVRSARTAAWRAQSKNSLRTLGMALIRHYEAHNRFPPPAIFGPDGTPLLSWRVAILPCLDQNALYKRFRLDEPWDSEHNKALVRYMPKAFGVRAVPPKAPFTTWYQVFVGPGAGFEMEPKLRLGPSDFRDGRSNTLMIVEAGEAVPWTKPQDVPFDPQGRIPRLGGMFLEGFHAVTFDNACHFFRAEIHEDEPLLRALIGRADGVKVDYRRYTGQR